MSTVEENIKALGAVLRQAGALSATLTYSGGGDSGDISELYVTWPEGKEEGVVGSVSYKPWHYFNEYLKTDQPKDAIEADFDTALTDIAFQVVGYAGHAGWENNEGGGGTFIVKENGSAKLAHYYMESDSDYSETEFTPEHRVFPYMKLIAEYLKGAGALSVQAEYQGYGDSGEEYDITVHWPEGKEGVMGDVTFPATEKREERTLDFESAVSDVLTWAIDEAGHSGYENNEGGKGELTITADGAATLEHNDYMEEEGDTTISIYGDYGDVDDGDVDDGE